MTNVRINSGELTFYDTPNNTPEEKWKDLFYEYKFFVNANIEEDCRYLLKIVEYTDKMYKKLGYQSCSDMIENGYELNPIEIEFAKKWLEVKNPKDKIGFKEAVCLGKTLQEEIQDAKEKPLNEHGTNQHIECYKKDGAYNVRSKKYGNNIEYQLKRLARDAPEILDQLEKGEIPSVRQAAIKAGIVNIKPNLKTTLKKLLNYYTKEEIIKALE